jgi:hypothetical protein
MQVAKLMRDFKVSVKLQVVHHILPSVSQSDPIYDDTSSCAQMENRMLRKNAFRPAICTLRFVTFVIHVSNLINAMQLADRATVLIL